MTRPTGYAPELAETVLKRIMDGEMLINVCAEDHMPTRDMFYGWMSGRPDLKQAYAREAGLGRLLGGKSYFDFAGRCWRCFYRQ